MLPVNIIQQEIESYQEALPSPDRDWLVDVRVFLLILNGRLFEPGLTLEEIKQSSGLRDHNIVSRFRERTRMNPKSYRLRHQLGLAKRLLQHEKLRCIPIAQIALAVGFDNPRVFSAAFKKEMGYTPRAYRGIVKQIVKEKNEFRQGNIR